MTTPALHVTNLHTWHENTPLLRGINLIAAPGQIVTLLGDDSSATDVLRAIKGVCQTRTGSIRIHGTESIHLPIDRINHLGIGSCPTAQGVFDSMTVEENLLLPFSYGSSLGGGISLAEIYEMCPTLYQMRQMPGTQLTGGEQRILIIARLLRTGVDLILLETVSHGLAPVVIQALSQLIAHLKERRYTIIMAESSLDFAGAHSDVFYRFENGQIVDQFASQQMTARRLSEQS